MHGPCNLRWLATRLRRKLGRTVLVSDTHPFRAILIALCCPQIEFRQFPIPAHGLFVPRRACAAGHRAGRRGAAPAPAPAPRGFRRHWLLAPTPPRPPVERSTRVPSCSAEPGWRNPSRGNSAGPRAPSRRRAPDGGRTARCGRGRHCSCHRAELAVDRLPPHRGGAGGGRDTNQLASSALLRPPRHGPLTARATPLSTGEHRRAPRGTRPMLHVGVQLTSSASPGSRSTREFCSWSASNRARAMSSTPLSFGRGRFSGRAHEPRPPPLLPRFRPSRRRPCSAALTGRRRAAVDRQGNLIASPPPAGRSSTRWRPP